MEVISSRNLGWSSEVPGGKEDRQPSLSHLSNHCLVPLRSMPALLQEVDQARDGGLGYGGQQCCCNLALPHSTPTTSRTKPATILPLRASSVWPSSCYTGTVLHRGAESLQCWQSSRSTGKPQ